MQNNLKESKKCTYFALRNQATPFFHEWIWPSSGGFFKFYYGLRRTRKVEPWWGNSFCDTTTEVY